MKKLLTIIISVVLSVLAISTIGLIIARKSCNSKSTQVSNIFLSKTTLELGVGETFNLVATISPNTADATLLWSSSNPNVATVTNGKVTAISKGYTVIKVEAPNGLLTVCNVTVIIKTGKLTGDVSYKYNNYIGNKPDTGTLVILISKNVKRLPDDIDEIFTNKCEKVYCTEVDGSGKYVFDKIPIGEYFLVLISKNTNDDYFSVKGKDSWGNAYLLFSEKGKKSAENFAKMRKTRNTTITIENGETVTYSYDFGITYW